MSVVVLLNSLWIGWGPFIWSVLASLLVLYYWTWSRSRYVRLVDAIPGPSYLPVLGNFLDLNVDHDGACPKGLYNSSFPFRVSHFVIYF